MIVLDASAALELALGTQAGARVASGLEGHDIHAPAHLDVEVVGVIRRAVLRGALTDHEGLLALADFQSLRIHRWSVPSLVERAYSLRATHSVAHATYVALAEGLDAPLLTCDARLARSHGHDADVIQP